ncbi:MAG: SGNH hydrolase domain-containing protein [Sulfurovum sp.]|nr:SGNH hydrolase domain-containing protein [Sulfurovum sp.]
MGFLSWKYIEERTRQGYLLKWNVFYLHILLSIILAGLSYIIFTLFQSQNVSYKTKVEKYINYDVTEEFRASQCFLVSKDRSMDAYKTEECVVWEKEKKNYLLLGDSHAAHYYRALDSLLKEDETLTQLNASGCLPVQNATWGDTPCQDLFQWTLETLIQEKHFDVIIISMANFHHTTPLAIHKSMKYIAQYTDKIVFLGRTMRYKQPLPRLLLQLSLGEESAFIHKIAGDYEYTLNLETTLQKVLKVDKLNYISILELMCTPQQSCRTLTPKKIPMYFDKDHFTKEGALYILKQVEEEVFDRE